MEDEYRTISGESRGLFKDKGSRFLAFAYPVDTEEEVRPLLDALRTEYHDARHHCYAWALGVNQASSRTNDDGEPSSSAGRPIFGQICSSGLTNLLIVVVRYFGGIKLGVPGLINAYREAAADAIRNAQVVSRTVDVKIRLSFDYLVLNDVLRVVKDENAEILERSFELRCELLLSIRQSNAMPLCNRLEKITSVTFPERVIF